jgi:transposase-like protein
LSYRHPEENRWAIRFLPLVDKMARKHKRAVGGSWGMDGIYIKVKGVAVKRTTRPMFNFK